MYHLYFPRLLNHADFWTLFPQPWVWLGKHMQKVELKKNKNRCSAKPKWECQVHFIFEMNICCWTSVGSPCFRFSWRAEGCLSHPTHFRSGGPPWLHPCWPQRVTSEGLRKCAWGWDGFCAISHTIRVTAFYPVGIQSLKTHNTCI